jgi:CDP-glucose 4,6-dehydratase
LQLVLGAAVNWQDKRVFITGATGLVGQRLTRALVARGANPVLLVRDNVPAMYQFTNTCNIVRGDVCDQPLMERILNEYDIEVIYHLAALSIVAYGNERPVGAYQTNVMGTVSVLEAARRVKPGARIVVASSDKAYGECDHLPYTEDTPLRGRNPYDCSKSCQDLIAQSYQLTQELHVAIARCGNIYGGGDLNWNRLIPNTIRRIVRGLTPVVYGTGYETRDLFYVEDCVNAYLCLVEKDATGPYNFSTGEELTVRSVIETICRLMDAPVHYDTLNQAKGQIPNQVLDSSKARAELGWQPVYPLESGLRKTIEWYREYLE